MEQTFTPGVWQYSHRKNKKGDYSTEVYCEDGETIATLSWYPMPPRNEIIEGENRSVIGTYRDGNARLISQAPEMYDLLSRIIGNKVAMEHVSDEWQNAVKSLIETIKSI